MVFSRFSFALLYIAFSLSILQNGSSAFSWTKNHLSPINTTNHKQMRHRAGLDVIRVTASKSSSLTIGDGDSDDCIELSSTSNWWRKDPRNRSVSGILICEFECRKHNSQMQLDGATDRVHQLNHIRIFSFSASFLSLLGFTMVTGPLVSSVQSTSSVQVHLSYAAHPLYPRNSLHPKTPALGKLDNFG
jgi:hypothetical protein